MSSKNDRTRRSLLILFCLCLWLPAAWADVMLLEPDRERYQPGQYVQVWEDPSGQVTASEVLTRLAEFEDLQDNQLSRGTVGTAWWLYLPLWHDRPRPAEWLLAVDFSSLDHLQVWLVYETGQLETLFDGGDRMPFHRRPLLHSSFLVPFMLQSGERSALLIRAQTEGSLVVPLRLVSKNAFIEDQEMERLLLGGIWGGLVFLLLYNMFLYLSVRDTTYLYYCAYILTFVLCTLHLAGVGFHYLWPDWIWFQNRGAILLGLLSALAANQFSRRLLDLRERHPRFDRVLQFFLVLTAILLVLVPFLPYVPTMHLTGVFITCMAMVMLSAGFASFVEGYPPARYYFLAWVTLFFAIIIFLLEMYGVFRASYLSKWVLQLGAASEALLFAIAMSDRINLLKQQTLAAKEKIVEQEQLLRTAQEKANRELEARVEQRTRELAQVAEDLARVNQQLDRMNQLDELTQVYNRRAFNQRSVQLLAQCKRDQRPFAVLLVDADHFKQVNDRYGHLAGDECLRQLAAVIRSRVTRPQDFVARLGGEEFAVVLFDTPEQGAAQVAERIRSEVQQIQLHWEDGIIPLTVSIGLCSRVPARDDKVEDFTHSADLALYRAKAEGRNRVVVAEPEPLPGS